VNIFAKIFHDETSCSDLYRMCSLYHTSTNPHVLTVLDGRELRAEMATKLQPVLSAALAGLDAGRTQILFEKVFIFIFYHKKKRSAGGAGRRENANPVCDKVRPLAV